MDEAKIKQVIRAILITKEIDPDNATPWEMVLALRDHVRSLMVVRHPTVHPMTLEAVLILQLRAMEMIYVSEGVNPYETFEFEAQTLTEEKLQRLQSISEAFNIAIEATLDTLEGKIKDGIPLIKQVDN